MAVIPVSREETAAFGIVKLDLTGRIVHFEEKPGSERLDALESDVPGVGRCFFASMGIYLFGRESLERSIADPGLVDFGRHVIPRAIGEKRVQAFLFRGYWEDVGTIRSCFEANLARIPPFDFYDAGHPVYAEWPLSALWVIGTFVAVELLCRGWAWVMLAFAVRGR